MKRITESTKITLTLGQLKRLVKESETGTPTFLEDFYFSYDDEHRIVHVMGELEDGKIKVLLRYPDSDPPPDEENEKEYQVWYDQALQDLHEKGYALVGEDPAEVKPLDYYAGYTDRQKELRKELLKKGLGNKGTEAMKYLMDKYPDVDKREAFVVACLMRG